MTIALTQLALIAALVYVLFARERDHQNALGDLMDLYRHERAQDALTARAERRELREQIDRLCQRIQAPEQAVIDHSIVQPLPSPPAVMAEDDEDFWLSRMSKEDLAAALDAQERAA